ncbi:MAG: glycosyltransferase family 39 protein [Bacteroidia bacterium]|nr:glycosyltransferase family 39 protein [Bacteroidia bacterium]
MKAILVKHIEFVVILCVCIVLRLLPFFDYQFTYDELSGLERTQFSSFSDLVHKGIKIDAHPAFVQLLIFALVKLFGYVTWVVKLPFLLFGFGAVIYGYALGYRNFSKSVGLVLAIVLSFSLVFVFYAPIARMYISGVFFSMALLFYFYELVFQKNHAFKNYFWFGAFALLSAMNQHMNSLFALTLFVAGLFLQEKQYLKKYLLCGVIAVVAYLPNLPVSLYQLGLAGIGREQGGWLDKPDWTAVFGFMKVMLGTGSAGISVVVLLVTPVLLNLKAIADRRRNFLLVIFLLNYLIIYLYSVYRAPIYQNSVMLFAGMAFLVYLASLYNYRNKYLSAFVMALLALVLIAKTYYRKDYFNQAVKTVYEYQFQKTFEYKKQFGDEKVYPLFFDVDSIMRNIYFKKYNGRFELKLSTDTLYSSMKLYSRFVSELKCEYLALSSAMPAQQAVAQQYFPYLLENTQTQAINYKLYAKHPVKNTQAVANDPILAGSNSDHPGALNYSHLLKNEWLMDSLNEFPFDAKGDYRQMVFREGNVVQLIAKIKINQQSLPDLEACINIGEPDGSVHYGYAAKSAREFVLNSDSTLSIYTDYFAGTSHPKISQGTQLAAYIWNKSHNKISLQQFEVRVIDYWPQKWQFWE